MKPSNELFELIKSLNKSEKRFFKLSSNLQSGPKNYIRLFDAIDEMTEYNEESLKQTFQGETFVKHLPSEKNHLYKLILKSLRSFHSDQSISGVLRQEIKNIEILYKKALYAECNKFLQRAKALAEQHEKFYYWFELISWEKQLLEEAYERGDFNRDLDSLIQEETDVINKLRNVAEYQILYSRINYVFRSGGFARNTQEREVVDEISNYHLIKGKNTALSVRASTICYYIKGLCAATNRNYKESYINFLKVKQRLDDYPHIRRDLSERYILTYQHLLNCYIDSKNFEACFELIEVLRQMENEPGFDTTSARVKIFTISYLAELLTYIRSGNFLKAVQLLDKILGGLEEYRDKVSKEKELLFAYYSAVAYFGNKDFNKALFWINRVLNDNEQVLRQDIYSYARILNLLIHFELENYDLLEYIIKSTNRFLNKKEKDTEAEQIILGHLKKLARNPIKENFVAMRSELLQVFQKDNERVVLDYIDVLSWVNSKIDSF